MTLDGESVTGSVMCLLPKECGAEGVASRFQKVLFTLTLPPAAVAVEPYL